LIPKSDVKKVVGIIREKGRTGYQGDGMVLVSPVDGVYKIKTDESGVHSV
jgi:nitrogen regulatory protein P-II 1